MSIFKLLDTFKADGFYVTQNYFANPSYYAQFNLLGHEGVDLGHSNKKVMVRTPISGTAYVGYDPAYGNYTVIEDYIQKCAVYICHTLLPVVVSGQNVNAGDPIAEMDDEGNANGEHVHFNFLILNSSGSNKYRTKPQNWGFLDPQYPRDTGNPVTFPGVEQYEVQWLASLLEPTTPPNGGPMPETMTVNKSDWDRLLKASQLGDRLLNGLGADPAFQGNIADKSTEQIDSVIQIRNQSALDKAKKDGYADGSRDTRAFVSQEMGLPVDNADNKMLTDRLKELVNQGNNNGQPIGNQLETVLTEQGYRIDSITIKKS